jgi:hypothetical protein
MGHLALDDEEYGLMRSGLSFTWGYVKSAYGLYGVQVHQSGPDCRSQGGVSAYVCHTTKVGKLRLAWKAPEEDIRLM